MKKKSPVSKKKDAVLAKFPYREFGKLLRDMRRRMGLSQVEMAEHLSLHPSYLSRLEHGERRPSLKVMRKLSEMTEYGMENLLKACGLGEERGPAKQATYEEAVSLRREITQLRRRLSQLAQAQMRRDTPRGRGPKLKAVPVFDAVPAGVLLPASNQTGRATATLMLPESELAEHPRAFALAVSGNSMEDAGILERDIVIISPDAKAKSGDTALVALKRDDISIKIVYFENGKVLLKTANRNNRPVMLRYPKDVEVLGKVILMWRSLG